MFMCTMFMSSETGGEPAGMGKTFTDIASEAFDAGIERRNELTFDVSQFKAKKEVSRPAAIKSTATIRIGR
jgi:hypothetical protein